MHLRREPETDTDQGRGDRIGEVIEVVAVARPLGPPHPRQRPVERIAEPVHHEQDARRPEVPGRRGHGESPPPRPAPEPSGGRAGRTAGADARSRRAAAPPGARGGTASRAARRRRARRLRRRRRRASVRGARRRLASARAAGVGPAEFLGDGGVHACSLLADHRSTRTSTRLLTDGYQEMFRLAVLQEPIHHATIPPMILRYSAFTDTPEGGNPAGVVLDASTLTDEQMQQIAKDVNYSESAFVTKREAAANTTSATSAPRPRCRSAGTPRSPPPWRWPSATAPATLVFHSAGRCRWRSEDATGRTTATADQRGAAHRGSRRTAVPRRRRSGPRLDRASSTRPSRRGSPTPAPATSILAAATRAAPGRSRLRLRRASRR